MRSAKRIRWLNALLVLALLGLAVPALAQVAGYNLSWFTVDSGGGASRGGGYALSGTVGQPDAGRLSGAAYVLSGGFWGGGATQQHQVFIPLVLKNPAP